MQWNTIQLFQKDESLPFLAKWKEKEKYWTITPLCAKGGSKEKE